MTILEILEAHTRSFRTGRCSCDNHGTKRTFHGHRSHVAGVLEEHMKEREAEAWDKGATFYDDADEIMLRANPYRKEPRDGC